MVGKISFVGVKTEFEPIENGTYGGKLADFKPGKTGAASKTPGADKIDLQFAITEEGDYKNRRLFRTYTFTAEALWAFKRTMSALNWEGDWEDPEGFDPEEIARESLNQPCLLKVSQREYQDDKGVTKVQNQIDDVLPYEMPGVADLPDMVATGNTA